MGGVFGMLASLLSGGSVDQKASPMKDFHGNLPTLDEGDEDSGEAHHRVVYIPPDPSYRANGCVEEELHEGPDVVYTPPDVFNERARLPYPPYAGGVQL